MEFEKKILSREIQQYLYESGLTVGTAESCTGGRIAEALIAVPGASAYFKGGIVSYTNEVKEHLLGVSHELLEEKTAVCEDVAVAMVKGAIASLNVDYAISDLCRACCSSRYRRVCHPRGGHPSDPGTVRHSCKRDDQERKRGKGI